MKTFENLTPEILDNIKLGSLIEIVSLFGKKKVRRLAYFTGYRSSLPNTVHNKIDLFFTDCCTDTFMDYMDNYHEIESTDSINLIKEAENTFSHHIVLREKNQKVTIPLNIKTNHIPTLSDIKRTVTRNKDKFFDSFFDETKESKEETFKDIKDMLLGKNVFYQRNNTMASLSLISKDENKN